VPVPLKDSHVAAADRTAATSMLMGFPADDGPTPAKPIQKLR
jgi:hypothetical protein